MTKLPNRVIIAPLRKSTYPDVFVFLDCETKQRNTPDGRVHHRLWFGCGLIWYRATDKTEERIIEFDYDTPAALWMEIDRHVTPKHSIYVFAHNLKFDFMVLEGFTRLPDLGYSLESLYHKFTTLIMKFKRDKSVINLADSMNYYQVALDKLAPMVGEEKIAADFTRPDKQIIYARCQSDVRIIYKAIRLIVDKLQADDLGSFKVTAPSVAFSMYRTKFLSKPIVTHHNDDMVQEERLSYYGGFVNVFNLLGVGSPDLYKLDINGMYPSVMRDGYFPVELVDVYQNPTPAKLQRLMSKRLFTARVILDTDRPDYPFRHNDAIYYPTGEFETVLSTPSLKKALERGHVKKVVQAAAYLRGKIFKSFVDYLYNERLRAKKAGDLAGEMFNKLMMNSLYGKFGQTATTSKYIGPADPSIFESYTAVKMDTGEQFREIIAGGSILHVMEDGESRYTFYSVAAHVTDYARMYLFDLIDRAGREHVYYSDTDSLVVDAIGYKRLRRFIHPSRLGKLKIEDSGSVFLGFAKKDYLLGNRRKLKGFSREPIQGRPHAFKSIQSSTLYGALHRNERSGSYWRTIEKIHNPFLRGVTVTPEGLVMPLQLPRDLDRMEEKIYTVDLIKSLVKQKITSMRDVDLSKWL